MNHETDSLCQTCGKPLKKSGSMTQWIFDTNRCFCGVSKADEEPRCALCGLPVKARVGSITQWIFKSQSCTCLVSSEIEERTNAGEIPEDALIGGEPYEFVGVTGHGGISTVYKANHKKLGRPVAVKILQSCDQKETAFQNFTREAKSASKLLHPNIVAVQDFGTMTDGRQFLVTEWIEGVTLAQYMSRHGRLSVEVATEIFSQVLDGLSHAHNRNVVHRDIKPSNIMLARGESGGWIVKIIDFGTAKEIDVDGARTRAEDMILSPFYMSPEMASAESIDHRADLYSLGCTLYEALSGKPPFTGKALSVVMRHQLEEPPTLESATGGIKFPQSIERIIGKLLAKEPAQRYQSADEAKLHLRNWANQSFWQKDDTISIGTTSGATGRSGPPWLVLGGGITIILLIVAARLIVLPVSEERTAPAPHPQRLSEEALLGGVLVGQWLDVQGKQHGLQRRTALSALPVSQLKALEITEKRNLTGIENFVGLPCLEIQFPVNEEDLVKIVGLKSIRRLLLPSTRVDRSQLDSILALPNLDTLAINGVGLKLEDWKAVSRKPGLQSLSCGSDKVTDEELEEFSKMQNLVALDVSRSQVTDQAILSLVSKQNTLVYLDVRDCLHLSKKAKHELQAKPGLWLVMSSTSLAGSHKVLPDTATLKEELGVEKAWSLSIAGRHKEAADVYNDVLDANPKSTRAFTGRSALSLFQHKWSDAVDDANRAINLGGRTSAAYNNRGRGHLGLNEPKSAIADFTTAIRLDQFSDQPHYFRALAYEALGEQPHALFDYLACVSLSSKVSRQSRSHPGEREDYINTAKQRIKALQSRGVVAEEVTRLDGETVRNYIEKEVSVRGGMPSSAIEESSSRKPIDSESTRKQP